MVNRKAVVDNFINAYMNTMNTHFATNALMAVIFSLISSQFRQLLIYANDNTTETFCGTSSPCRAGCYNSADNVSNDGDSHCVIVPAGHFSPEWDDTLRRCPEGTFMAQEGAEKCNLCPIGTAAPNKESLSCEPCDEGLYTSVPGSTSCKMCNPGVYFGPGSVGILRENGIEYCIKPTPMNPSVRVCDGFSTTPCSGGCYAAENTSIAANGTRVCIIVPHGFYSPPGDDILYMCPAGFYALDGSSECTLCAAGSASGIAGSGWCQLCPPSTFSSSEGAVSCSSCNSSLYNGPGSDTVLTVKDHQSSILYCQKPLKDSLRDPTSAPTQDETAYPATTPSIFEMPQSTSPLTAPYVPGPPTTSFPTPIFDLVSKQSRPPRNGKAPQPSDNHSQRSGDTSASNSSAPLFWIVYPLLAGAILATVVATFLYRRYRWLLWSRREIHVIPPLPPEEWSRQTQKPSPAPIPNIITTENKREDDEVSGSGLFLDDDLFFY
jgi:Tyrosine-protein kinase ephrin type A/B receptor-like